MSCNFTQWALESISNHYLIRGADILMCCVKNHYFIFYWLCWSLLPYFDQVTSTIHRPLTFFDQCFNKRPIRWPSEFLHFNIFNICIFVNIFLMCPLFVCSLIRFESHRSEHTQTHTLRWAAKLQVWLYWRHDLHYCASDWLVVVASVDWFG